MLSDAIPPIADRASLRDVGHALYHLELALIIGILHLLRRHSPRTIETILVRLHRLRLLLGVHELQVGVIWATRALKLFVLLVLGVGTLPRETEVHVLVAGVLRESHRRCEIYLAGDIARLIDTLARPNQVILLVSKFSLFLVVHHWRVIEFPLLVLVRCRPTCRQMLRHLAQLSLISGESLLLVH